MSWRHVRIVPSRKASNNGHLSNAEPGAFDPKLITLNYLVSQVNPNMSTHDQE